MDDAIPPGVELGIALQLVNVLRDVGEDAKRGRLYLPLDAVHAAGLTAEEILSGAVGERGGRVGGRAVRDADRGRDSGAFVLLAPVPITTASAL